MNNTTTPQSAQQLESLSRAQNGQSLANYTAIFEGFAAKGIAEAEILPRENVFTFNAWRALGRIVRKGEHGVKVLTWVTAKGTGAEAVTPEGSTKTAGFKFCRTTTVFHLSQTEAIGAAKAVAA
jgi:hypothetical protein